MILINEAKPKYTRLDEILEPVLTDVRFARDIVMVIDLKDAIRKFYRPDITVDGDPGAAIEEMSADIINIIAHYRNYFFKRGGRRTKFFILYSEEECSDITRDFPNYRYDYYQKRFAEDTFKSNIVKKAVFILSKVAEIIPNVAYINTSDYDELVYVKRICEVAEKNRLVFILSTDYLLYQCLDDNVFAITVEGIRSELITKTNVMQRITKRDDEFHFSSDLIPFLFTLAGIQKYSIPNIMGFANIRAATIIENMLKERKIYDCKTFGIPINFENLDEENKLDATFLLYEDELKEKYELLTRNSRLIKSSKLIDTKLLDLKKAPPTGTTFLELNAKIYNRYPLLIELLLKGEKIY